MNPAPLTLNPADIRAALNAGLRAVHGAQARLEDWTAQRVSNRGKHRTVLYNLDARVDGEPQARHYRWVGKYYEDDDLARKAAAILRELAASDCCARGDMVIPSVLAHHAPLRLLLLTYEPGQSVTSALGPHNPPVLLAIGRALAALHSTPVTLDGITSAADVLGDVRPRIAELCARFPGETDSLRQLQTQLERQAPRDPLAPSFVHGDLGPAQLIWQAGRIVVLDFDQCRRGDPASDLGNLLAQFRRIILRKPAKLGDFASLRRTLLEGYQPWVGADPGLARRVAWYELVTLVRKIYFIASDTTRHHDAEELRQRQEEAVRLLEELPSVLESDDPPAYCSTVVTVEK
ncbi:MAG TPA: aminoglycoside phosphotransferase family protein [Verrucomicrobiae bacterium]|jgi:tRNA A-37 threonylcarbamoyl transferase component Bud32